MTTVAEFIERNREQLIERYTAEVARLEAARGLTPYERTDTFPEFLSTLAAISRQGHRGDAEKTKKRLEETHIGQRVRVGFNQEEVTGEYVLMGRLISSLWEDLPLEQQPAQEDTRLLFEELQGAMDQVIVSFSGYSQEDRQREKRFLRRLNALAFEVMGDDEHFVPLQERLGALVEVVQEAMRAEGAALLLADPSSELLLPTTYTGRWSARTETEPVPVDGSSFVARIAASEEPVDLPDAAVAGDAVAEGVRRSGLHSLLGLRLWPYGKLLGVFYLGVAEIRPFEPQARRYLETLVEYLSGIIQKALLLQQLRGTNERLRKSEMLYRLATEAISDIIWEWNLQTDTLSWSAGVEKLFGHAREQLGGHISGWYDHIHPEDRERVVHGIHETIASGGLRWKDEYRFLHRDGGYVHVTDHGLVERDASGRAVRMVGAMQDITERKAASEALRVSEDRLRMAVRATELGTWDFNPVTGLLRWDERCKALFDLPLKPEVTYEASWRRSTRRTAHARKRPFSGRCNRPVAESTTSSSARWRARAGRSAGSAPSAAPTSRGDGPCASSVPPRTSPSASTSSRRRRSARSSPSSSSASSRTTCAIPSTPSPCPWRRCCGRTTWASARPRASRASGGDGAGDPADPRSARLHPGPARRRHPASSASRSTCTPTAGRWWRRCGSPILTARWRWWGAGRAGASGMGTGWPRW